MRQKFRVGMLIDYVISEYSELIIKGMKAACKDFDIELLIFPIGELHSISSMFDYQFVAITALITKNNLDGIIIQSGTQMHYMTKAEVISYVKSYTSIPIVSISLDIPGIPSILVECYNAYKSLLTELVQEQGCRKFGIMGVKSNSSEARSRMKYIKTILAELGILQKDITIWTARFDYTSSVAELETYIKSHGNFDFDALLSLNDEQAFACMDFCKRQNLRIPEDIVVAGFDNVLRGRLSSPTLTSIDQQIFEQGYEAVHVLKRMLCNEPVEPVTVIEAKAVLRKSTCRKPYSATAKKSAFATIDLPGTSDETNSAATDWYSKKAQFYQITRFYTDMQYDMSIKQFKSRINEDLKAFGITACAIIMFDSPVEMPTPFDYFHLPHKASVFSAYDDATGYESSKEREVKFDPNIEIIPEGIVRLDSDGMIAMSLFHNTIQYGYMLFRPGAYDIVVYDLLTKIVSSLVSSIYSFSLVHNESSKIHDKYKKLDIIASTDELTGMHNRRGLYDLGQTTLKFAKAMNQCGLIVYCDMDGLKKINDTYGHEAGDRAIVAESIILRSNFRSNDVVARIGGDEFAIISPGLTEAAFNRIRSQIDADCEKWTENNKSPFKLSISMGFVEYPSEKVGYQITPLLSEADASLYVEKRRKKSIPQPGETPGEEDLIMDLQDLISD